MKNPKKTLAWLVYKLIGSIMSFLCVEGILLLLVQIWSFGSFVGAEPSDVAQLIAALIYPALYILFIYLLQAFEKDFFPEYKQSRRERWAWIWIPVALGIVLFLYIILNIG